MLQSHKIYKKNFHTMMCNKMICYEKESYEWRELMIGPTVMPHHCVDVLFVNLMWGESTFGMKSLFSNYLCEVNLYVEIPYLKSKNKR